MTQTDPHRSLSRALDILELCSSSPGGYTLSQLSVRLSISKGSISPLLHTLRQLKADEEIFAAMEQEMGDSAKEMENKVSENETDRKEER